MFDPELRINRVNKAICIQLIFLLLIKFFYGTGNKYDTRQELNNCEIFLNFQNIKKAIAIKLSFSLQIKLQKGLFSAKYDLSFNYWCVHFDPVFGWDWDKYITSLELQRKEFAVNCQNINKEANVQLNFTLNIKLQNEQFSSKYDHFSANDASILIPHTYGTVHIYMQRVKY